MNELDLTSDEKIDLIYDMLVKQESRYKRALIAKWIFRIFIIGFLFLFYFIILPKLDINKIIVETIAPKMSQIIAPMAAESMKSISENMMSGTINESINLEMTPSEATTKKAELLKKLKEMQNK